jgi:circadian clock protein KaiB
MTGVESSGSEDKATPNGLPKRRLMLFIAGDGPNSAAAQENLQRICKAEPNYCLELQVVDVLKDYRAAQQYGVLVTPCLILVEPAPRAVVLGTLKDTENVRVALRLGSEARSHV